MSLWHGAFFDDTSSFSDLPNVVSFPDSIHNLSFCNPHIQKYNLIIQLPNWYLKTKFFFNLISILLFSIACHFPSKSIFILNHYPDFYKCAKILLVSQLKTLSCLFHVSSLIIYYYHLTFIFYFTICKYCIYMPFIHCNNKHVKYGQIMT